MTLLRSTLCIFQSLLGFGSSKARPHSGTDWLKLALAVAAQPEDDESRKTVRAALQTNNQEFLDYLRSALDTRSTAAARVAEINQEGVECRAFLPGSPALWGWTTNMAAEAAVLQDGIEAAIQSSVFDSPSVSCSNVNENVPAGMSSSETMGGATLRDIYAKAWELHREPLIWTPRGAGSGSGESTWMLTPVSLTMPSVQTRARRASDASDARSSVVGMSPCLYAQRNRVRRDSLHDVFINPDKKQKGLASPFAETGMATPSPSSSAALPQLEFDPPSSFQRRSTSCTRSHVSCTTAVTVSECSTTQELPSLGLGLSLGGSTCSRPSTPSDFGFGDHEMGREMAPRGRKLSYHLLGGRTRVPSGPASRRNQVAGAPVDNSKQFKLRRPGAAPLQRVQASISKRPSPTHDLSRTASPSRILRDGSPHAHRSPINRIVSGAQSKIASNPRDKFTPLRRVQSVAIMTLSPSPQLPRIVAPKVPLLGPVPAAKRAMTKHFANSSLSTVTGGLPNSKGQNTGVVASRRSSYQASRLISAPATPQQPSDTAPRTPSTSQSRIPRPASRASMRSAHNTEFTRATPSPRSEPRQLQTPTSTVRERASFSQFPRPVASGTFGRARSQTGGSTRERPRIAKDVRLSRPSSRVQIAPVRRTVRSDSIASSSTMADWQTNAEESFSTAVFA